MARLLRDRVFEYAPDQAWDLATGEAVHTPDLSDEAPAREPSLAALVEVLEHGCDGRPRWVATDAPPGRAVTTLVRAAADQARAHGYVPVAADLYLRLRTVLADDLRDRALVLIVRPSLPAHVGRAALMDASARSCRPHVLLMLRPPDGAIDRGASWALRAQRGSRFPLVVREARAAYGVLPQRATAAAPLSEDLTRYAGRASRAAEFVRAGRHAAAERLLREVAAGLERRRAPGLAATTYLSLGRILLERGRASGAESIFEEAARQAEAGGDEALGSTARVWQAAARTDAAQFTAAESLCRAVLLAGHVDVAERRRAEATLARVLLWQGRGREAAGLAFVTSDSAGEVDAFVEATAVRVLLEDGEMFRAGLRVERLVAAAGESRDPFAPIIAAVAHLRVLLAMGELGAAEQRLGEIQAYARTARAPFRAFRARVLWLDALRQAGRARDGARELARLQRLCRAAPPLLRAEIDRRIRAPVAAVRRRDENGLVPAASAATALLAIAQREDSDRDALRALLEFAGSRLQVSRAEIWSNDAGPSTPVLVTGCGLPTRVAVRVLEAGIVVGPEQAASGWEIGAPVRLGSKLLAALSLRWPADRTPPAAAEELLTLTAAVAAPRIEALLAESRASAHAARAIPELVGTSAAMAEVRKAVTRAAAAPFAVLIEGESGVGKELVARAIHQLGPRRERRFCDVNCAALPDDLFESELFGYARGAFTGAVTDRAGLVEEADGGTLFLDEVADLSPRAQAKLLRVVQQQDVRRIGETFSRAVDVRFVGAANRDLRVEAAAGRFRHDLLYRLDVIRIRIPPLRERPEDVPLLAEHFWRTAAARVGSGATLTHGVLSALARYHWPGNVRELQNVIAALAVEAPARGLVHPSRLPAVVGQVSAVTSGRLADARAQFERRFVEMALARAGGSRTRAARELGLSRQGLLKLMGRLGMTEPSRSEAS